VSWIRLDGLRIAEVRFLASAEEVRTALGGAPATSAPSPEQPRGEWTGSGSGPANPGGI
jgi:hypothetical protein